MARSVDGTNHGSRLKKDRRRLLYREFLKYVAYFQPKVFVMENVLGIRNAAEGNISRGCITKHAISARPTVTMAIASTRRSRTRTPLAFLKSGNVS